MSTANSEVTETEERTSPLVAPPAPSAEPTAEGVVLTVTETAIETILGLREAEDDSENLALRVSVTGTAGYEYTYDLTFEALAEAGEDDVIYNQGVLPVMVPLASVDQLDGATLDLPANGGGLVLRNPNRPDPLSGKDLELTGDTAEKVQQLLDGRINPGLASHGGFAKLEGIEGDKVYVTMGGGCQGCAVSAMTLRDGIAKAIVEAIPEISEVVDVTDHNAGENPFYS